MRTRAYAKNFHYKPVIPVKSTPSVLPIYPNPYAHRQEKTEIDRSPAYDGRIPKKSSRKIYDDLESVYSLQVKYQPYE